MKVLYSLLQTAISSGNGSDRNAFWAACYCESSVKLANRLCSQYRHLGFDESLDFIHDAFEKLMKKDVKDFERYFENENKMEGLLWVTTWRIYLNRLKQTNPEPLEGNEHIMYQSVSQPPKDGDIARLLNQIDEKQARAFVRHVYEGYEQKEIAEMEGVTLSAIKMRIKRAKEALQKAFEADS